MLGAATFAERKAPVLRPPLLPFGRRGLKTERNQRRRVTTHVPHSGSLGLLKRTVNLILPCPFCGKLGALGFPGSKLEAVSSGGNNESVSRKCRRSPASPWPPFCRSWLDMANASRDAWASPPW